MLQFGERCKWEIESVFGGLTERNNIPAKKRNDSLQSRNSALGELN